VGASADFTSKFTSYERDTETGLDYAFARYYSSRLGRFLFTDPLGGSIGDLQSHNAYAYTVPTKNRAP
jgi:RHS repeat-associated protein